MMNVMGLMQWLIIGAFGIYFYTYSFDIYGVLQWEHKNKSKKD